MYVPRILIIDTCDRDREWLRAIAHQVTGQAQGIDTAATFEMAVMAASRTDYHLVMLGDDLGVGTSPMISVVTLRAAGCTGRILVTGTVIRPQRQHELSRVGVLDYLEKRTLTPAYVRQALFETPPMAMAAAV